MAEPVQRDGKRVGLISSIRLTPLQVQTFAVGDCYIFNWPAMKTAARLAVAPTTAAIQ